MKFTLLVAVIAIAISSGMIDKKPQTPLECYGAQSITYTYEVDGTEIIDLDTGRSYNYYRCIPLRFEGDM